MANSFLQPLEQSSAQNLNGEQISLCTSSLLSKLFSLHDSNPGK